MALKLKRQLVQYQWDAKKADSNLRKHSIDFADAVGVFEDEWALTIEDQSILAEARFITIGMDFLGRVVVVAYTYRKDDNRV